ncbi:MAG: hypothetical protein OHK0029_39120 [Armatimonadaceae bacterium]
MKRCSPCWYAPALVSLLSLFVSLTPAPATAQEDPAEASATTARSPSRSPLRDEDKIELHRIRIVNQKDGAIQGSTDQGKTWRLLGRVIAPAVTVAPGYVAAEYAPQGSVAATATHGIRLRIGADNPNGGPPTILGVEPVEYASRAIINGQRPNKGFGGYISGTAGIFTDIPAGRSLFGGLAPLPGNPLLLETTNGKLIPLPPSFMPQGRGEVLQIVVQAPKNSLSSLVFENRTGGAVTATYEDGTTEQVSQVVRPVKGVGRFDGTAYTGVGKLNTAHTGVITVSTAPENRMRPEGVGAEQRGGFQISPEWHSSRTEEFGAPQVMTVGTPGPRRRELEGIPPLFLDTVSLYGNDAVVEVSVDNGPWEPMPTIVGLQNEAFTGLGLTRLWKAQGVPRTAAKGITAFRFTLPTLEPPMSETALAAASDAYRKLRLIAARNKKVPIVTGILTINANPTNATNVSMVRFLVEGSPKGFTNIPPYAIRWDTRQVPDGEYLVEAEAMDENGSVIATSRRRVFVLNEEKDEEVTASSSGSTGESPR